MSVSYTHLDVYKRQLVMSQAQHGLADPLAILQSQVGGAGQVDDMAAVILGFVQAVRLSLIHI